MEPQRRTPSSKWSGSPWQNDYSDTSFANYQQAEGRFGPAGLGASFLDRRSPGGGATAPGRGGRPGAPPTPQTDGGRGHGIPRPSSAQGIYMPFDVNSGTAPGGSGMGSSVGGDVSAAMPETRLKIYSDLFEEVIERDRVFGSLLRKIKTAYDMLVLRGPEQDSTMRMTHEGAGTPGPGEGAWTPEPSSVGHYVGAHSNEPTTRAEDGMQAWEMHRENRVLKDLVERLNLELEEAVKREHRWKQKVVKLKSRAEPMDGPLQAMQAHMHGHYDGHSHPGYRMHDGHHIPGYHGPEEMWAAPGYQKGPPLPPEDVRGPGGLAGAGVVPGQKFFHANRREPTGPPDPEGIQEGALNQGGLLSMSSISPQTSAPQPESLECMGGISERSTDSGILPQRPTRRVVRPGHVPALDLSRLNQQLEEDEEEEDEEGLMEQGEAGDQGEGEPREFAEEDDIDEEELDRVNHEGIPGGYDEAYRFMPQQHQPGDAGSSGDEEFAGYPDEVEVANGGRDPGWR